MELYFYSASPKIGASFSLHSRIHFPPGRVYRLILHGQRTVWSYYFDFYTSITFPELNSQQSTDLHLVTSWKPIPANFTFYTWLSLNCTIRYNNLTNPLQQTVNLSLHIGCYLWCTINIAFSCVISINHAKITLTQKKTLFMVIFPFVFHCLT
jgi:hypothetical protein